MKTLKYASLALGLALAAPAFAADPAPMSQPGDREIVTRTVGPDGKVIEKHMIFRGGPDGGPGMGGMHGGKDGMKGMGGPGMAMGGWGAFDKLSPEGRETLKAAMKVDREPRREAVEAARAKMLAVLSADRLDTGALKAAMAEERAVVERQGTAHQAAMLAAFQKLSAADRKAFAESMRTMHDRMETRMKEMRERMKGMHGRMMMMHGPGDMPMPPVPPVPPVTPKGY